MNRIINTTIIVTSILFAGCAFDGADESSGSTEQEQTFGAPGFPMPAAQRIDPGDIVDTDSNFACSITVDAEQVTPGRTVKGIARSTCKASAAASCSGSEVDGVAGVVLNSTTLQMDCEGLECSGRAIVQCLYNVGG
jgi:hypothetical protein